MNEAQRVKVFREAAQVRRMHCVPMHTPYTVGQHSHGALDLLLLLHPRPSVALIKAVQWHDKHERFIGDVPAPAKWGRRQFGNALDAATDDIDVQLGVAEVVDALEPDERVWLGAVDIVDLLLACEEEMQMGNMNVWTTYNACKDCIARIPLPEPIRQFLVDHEGMHRETELTRDGAIGTGHLSLPRDLEETLAPF